MLLLHLVLLDHWEIAAWVKLNPFVGCHLSINPLHHYHRHHLLFTTIKDTLQLFFLNR